jgi:hypothetical protein
MHVRDLVYVHGHEILTRRASEVGAVKTVLPCRLGMWEVAEVVVVIRKEHRFAFESNIPGG